MFKSNCCPAVSTDDSGSDKTGPGAADGAESELGTDGLSEKLGKSTPTVVQPVVNKKELSAAVSLQKLYFYIIDEFFRFFTKFPCSSVHSASPLHPAR